MVKYSFDNKDKTFFNGLKKQVDEYFSHQNLHPAGNEKLYVKSFIQVGLASLLYVILVFFTPPTVVSVALCILLGFNLAVIGFNVMHEGGHQAFSKYAWVNNVSSYFLNVLGGISYYWKIKHNINHHTYTNVEGMDSDIDVKPFMRLHADQPWRPYHRFQHYYWLPLYGISYLAWIFYEDFLKYFRSKISPNGEVKALPLREHLVFWFTKLMYIAVYMVIPILVVGFLPWLIGFLIIAIVCGITTSVVFQLAHVVPGTQFHLPGEQQSKNEWAVHQVLSTANFGTSDKVLHWLLGGLNFQIEHHLFPRISHIHYPAISGYVKRACSEQGIRYHEFSTMLSAFVSHIVYLRRLGMTAAR